MALFGMDVAGITVDSVSQIIQMALTPVFLLTGLATLLNVFSTRLARVTTKADQTLKELAEADAEAVPVLRDQLVFLRRRTLALDAAVVLAAAAGAGTCTTVLLLFIGAFAGNRIDLVLLWAFGAAIVCALGAIAAYAAELLMAGTGIRAELVHRGRRHLLWPHRDT